MQISTAESNKIAARNEQEANLTGGTTWEGRQDHTFACVCGQAGQEHVGEG
jgi:hypothetical protein